MSLRRALNVVLVLLWLVALVRMPAVAAEPAARDCSTPPDLMAAAEALPHTTAALHAGGRLDVLALSSASLLGPREGVEGSVPDRMVQQLRAAFPAASIRLTLHAERAEAATDMLATLKRELAARTWQLVLWQAGTAEALRHQPADQFQATLAEGVALVAAAHADLVLIDLPFSRLLDTSADLEPYRAAIREVASRQGVPVFPRYDLMRAWAESGELDLESSARRDRRRTADELRACLGAALARMLAAAPGE